VQGRPIGAVELGDPHSPRKVLVVGCIHGNECAGIAVVRRLEQATPATGTDLWLVEDLNPDGHATSTRQNAHDVDLNRNFPWHWRHDTTGLDSGPEPLSEPETQVAARLILRLRPAITIWFHQDLAVVDLSGGDPAVEQRFARLAGLPARRLPRYPGSATGWENHRFPNTTAFVVELPPGRLTPKAAGRYARAVLELSRSSSAS
jgi:protein MpaA